MPCTTVRTDLLYAYMAASGYNKTSLAKALGMSTRTLYNKLNKGVFCSDEIGQMIFLLHIEDPMPIFFAAQLPDK